MFGSLSLPLSRGVPVDALVDSLGSQRALASVTSVSHLGYRLGLLSLVGPCAPVAKLAPDLAALRGWANAGERRRHAVQGAFRVSMDTEDASAAAHDADPRLNLLLQSARIIQGATSVLFDDAGLGKETSVSTEVEDALRDRRGMKRGRDDGDDDDEGDGGKSRLWGAGAAASAVPDGDWSGKRGADRG
jgi:hypothetical protein